MLEKTVRSLAPCYTRGMKHLLLALLCAFALHAETWRGLTVDQPYTEENCAKYARTKYGSGSRYRKHEKWIAAKYGQAWSPYDSQSFDSIKDTEVEHIVSLREAHYSGLCKENKHVKKRFAADMENLTLASPTVNKDKGTNGPEDWIPDQHVCWYVNQRIMVKRMYGLTVTKAATKKMDEVIEACGGKMHMPGLW